MLFNSYIFIFIFLPVVLTSYFLLNKFGKYKESKIVLLAASIYFYGYFNVNYLYIIVSSILFNFLINKSFRKIKNKKIKLIVFIMAICVNVGSIFYFKYFDFFASTVNSLFNTSFNLLHLVLPLAISFFTFEQLSYIIDNYKGQVPDYSFLDYSLFVTFFPKLIAGPIMLYSELIPQFQDEKKKKFNYENFSKGITAFSFGLAKKILIADTFGVAVNYAFDTMQGNLNATNLIIATLAYTFQIYFDFSGYCDMATGLGKMFNIDIPMNFNSPYKSYTITEFWKRWHITLTRFFTSYIYIPLGGNKKGNVRTYFNIFIVFLISGLWHGAGFAFILWGILHGTASIINRIYKKRIDKLNPVFNWICTFLFINITWIFFRANSIVGGSRIIKNILSFNFGAIDNHISTAFNLTEFTFLFRNLNIYNFIQNNIPHLCMMAFFIFAIFSVLCMKNTNERIEDFRPNNRILIVVVILFVWSIFSLSGVSTFLYFNF